MELYSEVKNDMNNAYLDNGTAEIVKKDYTGLHHNMQLVYHIEKVEDVDKSYLIYRRIF